MRQRGYRASVVAGFLCAVVGAAAPVRAQGPVGAAPLRGNAAEPSSAPALLKAVGAVPPVGGTAGPVVASIRVESTGQVSAITVLRGDPGLKDTAVAALRPWVFARQAEAFDAMVMVNVLPVGGITFNFPSPPPPASVDVPLPGDPNFSSSVSAVQPAGGAAAGTPATARPGGAPAGAPSGAATPAVPRVMEMAPLRVGGPITAPTKLLDARPEYPRDALDRRIQGVVVIEVVIGTDGSVHLAHAVRQVPGLTEAALAAVGHWVFAETLLNGQPVPLLMTVTVNFTLQ